MHVPINVKSPNNISEWQMGFNSAFKGLIQLHGCICRLEFWSTSGQYVTQKFTIYSNLPVSYKDDLDHNLTIKIK